MNGYKGPIPLRPSIFGADRPHLDLPLPPRTHAIILAEQRYGLRPTRLLLPHQLYAADLAPNVEYAVLPVVAPWLFISGPMAGKWHGADPYGDLIDRIDELEAERP